MRPQTCAKPSLIVYFADCEGARWAFLRRLCAHHRSGWYRQECISVQFAPGFNLCAKESTTAAGTTLQRQGFLRLLAKSTVCKLWLLSDTQTTYGSRPDGCNSSFEEDYR